MTATPHTDAAYEQAAHTLADLTRLAAEGDTALPDLQAAVETIDTEQLKTLAVVAASAFATAQHTDTQLLDTAAATNRHLRATHDRHHTALRHLAARDDLPTDARQTAVDALAG